MEINQWLMRQHSDHLNRWNGFPQRGVLSMQPRYLHIIARVILIFSGVEFFIDKFQTKFGGTHLQIFLNSDREFYHGRKLHAFLSVGGKEIGLNDLRALRFHVKQESCSQL